MTRTLFLLLFVTITFQVSAQIAPIANWNFNSHTKDKSGNGWDAISRGCTLTAGKNGKPNTAYKFNGNGNYMIVPHKAAMNMKKWTIMALVKPQGFYNGPCQGNMIVERGEFYTASSHSLYYFDNAYDNDCNIYTPNKMVFAANAAGTNPVDWKTGVFVDTLNTWYCVAATYGNDTMKLYVNGVLVKKEFYTDQYGTGVTDSLRIGCGAKMSTHPNWFNGIMDHLSIYDTVLTLNQVNTACTNGWNDTTVWTPESVSSINADLTSLELYPNPATNMLEVQLQGTNRYNTVGKIQVVNTIGQVVMTTEMHNTTSRLDVSTLPSGIYYVKIDYNGLFLSGRFQKQ